MEWFFACLPFFQSARALAETQNEGKLATCRRRDGILLGPVGQRVDYQAGRHLQERPSKAGEPSPGRTTWGRSSEQSPAGWARPRPEGASRAETPEAAAPEAGLWRRPRRPPALGREAAPGPPHRLDPPPPPPLSGRFDRAAASTLAPARVPPKRRRSPAGAGAGHLQSTGACLCRCHV